MCNENKLEGAALPPPLFALGFIVVTAGASALLNSNAISEVDLLARHECGNWGEAVSPEDAQANADAVSNGGRIFSAFLLPDGQTIWIITEAGRSFTIILMPTDFL